VVIQGVFGGARREGIETELYKGALLMAMKFLGTEPKNRSSSKDSKAAWTTGEEGRAGGKGTY